MQVHAYARTTNTEARPSQALHKCSRSCQVRPHCSNYQSGELTVTMLIPNSHQTLTTPHPDKRILSSPPFCPQWNSRARTWAGRDVAVMPRARVSCRATAIVEQAMITCPDEKRAAPATHDAGWWVVGWWGIVRTLNFLRLCHRTRDSMQGARMLSS